MQDNTFYVRNWRPNAVVFKYAGLKYVLERRGDRKDTVALPNDAKSDSVVARWLRINILEEISREDFVELAARVTDGPFGPLRSRAKEVDIPIEKRNSDRPTTIPTELIDDQKWRSEYLSPHLEYMTPPTSTEEEMAAVRAKNGPTTQEYVEPKPKRRARKDEPLA